MHVILEHSQSELFPIKKDSATRADLPTMTLLIIDRFYVCSLFWTNDSGSLMTEYLFDDFPVWQVGLYKSNKIPKRVHHYLLGHAARGNCIKLSHVLRQKCFSKKCLDGAILKDLFLQKRESDGCWCTCGL